MSQKLEIKSLVGDLEEALQVLDAHLASRPCIICPKIAANHEILAVADALHSSQHAIDRLNQIQETEE